MFYTAIKCISHSCVECLVQTASLMVCFVMHSIKHLREELVHVHAMCDTSSRFCEASVNPNKRQLHQRVQFTNFEEFGRPNLFILILRKLNGAGLTAEFTLDKSQPVGSE